MNMLTRMLGRGAKVNESPTFVQIEAIEGTNARATARRVVRAQRAAPITVFPEVKLTEAEEEGLRKAYSKRDHIPADEVDLDTVETVSGQHRRAIRRAMERDERKRRRKGQRAFNRMVRENPEPATQSGSEKVKAGRQRKDRMQRVADLIKQGVEPVEAYEQVLERPFTGHDVSQWPEIGAVRQ